MRRASLVVGRSAVLHGPVYRRAGAAANAKSAPTANWRTISGGSQSWGDSALFMRPPVMSGMRRGLATAADGGDSKSPTTGGAGNSATAGGGGGAPHTPRMHPIKWVDEDEALSLDPKVYAFDQEDDEDVWERLAGVSDNALGGHAARDRLRGYGKAKERLAKKFPIEYDAEEGEDEDEDEEDDLPSVGEGKRQQQSTQQQQQAPEGEEEPEVLTARERQLRAKEEEKDKQWALITAPLKENLEAQINDAQYAPLWYPHVDEYEGDGYDDYSRTMQGTWEDDSPFHRDYEYDEKEFKDHYSFSISGHQHILNVGRHTKTTKGGRVFSYSATVIDGNGNGRAGWGYGKGPTLSDAVLAAQKDCERNSFFIDRYKGLCITESIRFSYKKCSVDLFALPEGRMHPTSSQVMQLVFNAFGLQYIAGKWRGSTNKTKRIKTLFMALQQAEHPDYLSEKLGMKLFKPRKVPRKHGRVWAYD